MTWMLIGILCYNMKIEKINEYGDRNNWMINQVDEKITYSGRRLNLA